MHILHEQEEFLKNVKLPRKIANRLL